MKTAAAFLIAVATLCGQPKMSDAKLETRPLATGGSLASEVSRIATNGPTWIAWQIATLPNTRQMCCTSDRCSWGCSLAGWNDWNGNNCNAADAGPPVARLEGFREAYVFIRIENRQVDRIRTFSPDCQIDGGGLPVLILSSVTPAANISFLKTFINWDSGKLAEQAVNALGMMSEPEIGGLLEQYATTSQPERVRRQAAYWLGYAHPQRGVPLLTKLAKEDVDPKFREHCAYALSLSKPGVAVLLQIANSKTADAKVRQKAVFWLARSKEPEAQRYIEGVLSR